MKMQFKLFLTSLMFFTRIPVPGKFEFTQDNLNRSNRYFPLIGIIVGCISAIIFYVGNNLFNHSLGVLLSIITSILITGAFHEDGFADVCDAFGGGWTKDKILIIMKDSRLGAYGVIGIFLLLLGKFLTLTAIPPKYLPITMIMGHTLSRSMATWSMFTLSYVREDESSKSKPITKNLVNTDLIIALITGAITLLLLPQFQFLWIIIPLILTKIYFEKYFKKWIGGYTGDCLGTIQQITEIVFYFSLLAALNIHSNESTFQELKNLF